MLKNNLMQSTEYFKGNLIIINALIYVCFIYDMYFYKFIIKICVKNSKYLLHLSIGLWVLNKKVISLLITKKKKNNKHQWLNITKNYLLSLIF